VIEKLGDILKAKMLDGLTVRFSDGAPFDPADQERTSAMADIMKSEEVRRGNNESMGKPVKKTV